MLELEKQANRLMDKIHGHKTYATAVLLAAVGLLFWLAPPQATWTDPQGEQAAVVRNTVGPLMVGLGAAVAALRHGMKKTEQRIIRSIRWYDEKRKKER